jgi:hypothetical protein
MKRAMYKVPHYKGSVGTAANFARHIAERAKAESWTPRAAVAVN